MLHQIHTHTHTHAHTQGYSPEYVSAIVCVFPGPTSLEP